MENWNSFLLFVLIVLVENLADRGGTPIFSLLKLALTPEF
jgi:hypothetical protein